MIMACECYRLQNHGKAVSCVHIVTIVDSHQAYGLKIYHAIR